MFPRRAFGLLANTLDHKISFLVLVPLWGASFSSFFSDLFYLFVHYNHSDTNDILTDVFN